MRSRLSFLIVLSAFISINNFFAFAQEKYSITLGKNDVFTVCNYHYTELSQTPEISSNTIYMAASEGNIATTQVRPIINKGGLATALVGFNFMVDKHLSGLDQANCEITLDLKYEINLGLSTSFYLLSSHLPWVWARVSAIIDGPRTLADTSYFYDEYGGAFLSHGSETRTGSGIWKIKTLMNYNKIPEYFLVYGKSNVFAQGDELTHYAESYAKVSVNEVSFTFTTDSTPVILVHGWRGDPSVWNNLIAALDARKIKHYQFKYAATGDIIKYAKDLQTFIDTAKKDLKDNYGYTGKLDIVCHSMGALVSRYYMEVLPGPKNIRQWIGIAPVSRGTGFTELDNALWFFVFPVRLFLLPIIFPDLRPSGSVVEMQTSSPIVKAINDAGGTTSGVTYRVITGINQDKKPLFNGLWGGKTKVEVFDANNKNKKHKVFTYYGDGLVALEQSVFQGVFSIDCVNETHNELLKNDYVIYKVISYHDIPDRAGQYTLDNCPLKDDLNSLDIEVPSLDKRGWANHNEQKTISITVDKISEKINKNSLWLKKNQLNAGVKKATFGIVWARPESKLNIILTSPSDIVMQEGISPVVEYGKDSTHIMYAIDSPEPGTWTAKIQAIEVPANGEPYIFQALYSSPLQMDLSTSDGKNSYNPNEKVSIIAGLTDQGTPITAASVRTEIMRPDSIIDKVTLYDDGTHGDALANDGNYTNVYSLPISGAYEITAYANGTNERVFERIAYLDIYAAENTTAINEKDNKKDFPPADYHLRQNYPNPFNSSTSIGFTIKKDDYIELYIYNIQGRPVRKLLNKRLSSGAYDVSWDGTDNTGNAMSSGLYFYEIKALSGYKEARKMVFLK